MFVNFFYALRRHQIPVSLTEWMLLMQALSRGFAESSLQRFYTLARALLVKDVSYYDAYDVAFREAFQGIETPEEILAALLAWLQNPQTLADLSLEQQALLAGLDLQTLRQLLGQRLREQRERHDGGNRLIGTGGTSPFGHQGRHPAGIRIGDRSGQRSAVQIAEERQFQNYRHDRTLDIRHLQVALKKLRHLQRVGRDEELDLEETVNATCKNGGEIELIFRPPPKNHAKVLLLMDAGGSMLPYTTVVEQLFSAAHQTTHFKDFRHYYFHNCIYEQLYIDMGMNKKIATPTVLQTMEADYKVILVGDAYMAPEELLEAGGAIYYYHNNDIPGIEWLRRVRAHFRACIWLNPMPERHWDRPSIALIRTVFPMYELTLEGLDRGVKHLVRKAA
jgi:uncharacterized protein with von Willebrand factor type A (vWA) domain